MRSLLIKPKPFVNGGKVKPSHKNIPVHALKPKDPDQVLARLMPGEIVIPVKHASKVKKMLKQAKIKLPGL
jgi:hypothetical protein